VLGWLLWADVVEVMAMVKWKLLAAGDGLNFS
jgi:hypothetical protein